MYALSPFYNIFNYLCDVVRRDSFFVFFIIYYLFYKRMRVEHCVKLSSFDR